VKQYNKQVNSSGYPGEFFVDNYPFGEDVVRTGLRFDIPDGATGCRLHIDNPLYPYNPHNPYTDGTEVAGQIKVLRVQEVTAGGDWDHQPAPYPGPGENVVATWNWQGGPSIVWADDCQSSLSFLFEWDNGVEQKPGSYAFGQMMNENDPKQGWSIVYDCTQ
jgi:hypothetical protein